MDEEAVAYFQAVERHFIERRGRPLLLSPGDVERVSAWHRDGIPLAAVFEGIDIHFDRLARRARPARRAVTLAYLDDDVLEAWAGTKRRRLGRAGLRAAPAETLAGAEDHARFVDALTQASARLWEGDAVARRAAPVVEAAAAKLSRKADLFDPSGELHDPRKAEEALRRIERSMQQGIRGAVGPEALGELEREVTEELSDKRSRLDEATWHRIRTQLVDKKLRETLGLPRLSLFYT